MTDVSVNELLALIGEQSVKLRLYETQLEAALGRIAELETTNGSDHTASNQE